MKKIRCESKSIISIGEQQVGSDLFLVIDFVLNDTNVNLNGVQYSEDFLNEIAQNSDKYQGIPLKVDYNKLISGNTKNLTHNFANGKFYNQMIGSFTKFYTQRNEQNILELCGSVRIPKEFAEACEVIQQLYDDNALFVSYEIIVGKYTEKNNGEIKFVDKDESNYLEGYSIVSTPAVVSAKAIALVAELINKNNEGGENTMPKKLKDMSESDFIAEIKSIDKCKNIKIAELSYDQVMTSLYNQLKIALDDAYWEFYPEDHGVDFLIMESCQDGSLIRIDFTVDSDEVVITNCYPVTKSYPAIAENNNEEGNDNMPKTAEQLQAELAEVNANLKIKEKDLESKDKEIAEVNEKLTNKDTELADVNSKLSAVSETLVSKEKEIAGLNEIKEKYDAMVAEKAKNELAEKSKALKEKYSKLLSAEVLAKPEIAEAIEKVDETVLSAAVVEIALEASKTDKSKVETASKRVTDTAKLDGEDPTSLRAKYSI